MKEKLDQIVTFGRGVKAFRIVMDTDDVAAEEKADNRIVLTENAIRLGDELRAELLPSNTVSK